MDTLSRTKKTSALKADRRKVLAGLSAGAALPILAACGSSPAQAKDFPIQLTPAQWRRKLTKQEYYILREAGTEPAFAGALYDNHEAGDYLCGACGLPLFESKTKYDSGSGWPSFTQPVNEEAVTDHRDMSHGMIRTESRCGRCDSHLGHVFPDGPPPTGLRYCMNSLALEFRPLDSE